MTKLKLTKQPALTPAQVFSLLLNSGTQAHLLHFNTESFSIHKALEKYYEKVVSLTDILVEVYQGLHGKVKIDQNFKSTKADDPIALLDDVYSKVSASKDVFKETELLNLLDEILQLINQTKYRVQNLK